MLAVLTNTTMMNSFVQSAGLASLFFTTTFALALILRKGLPNNWDYPLRTSQNVAQNNSSLSSLVQLLIKEIQMQTKVQDIPWNTTLKRKTLTCKLETCRDKYPAYAIELPVLFDPYATTNDWDPYQTSWNLSTQQHFRTGYPSLYPVATVCIVPPDTPSHVKYILDINNLNPDPDAGIHEESDGIRPMILSNNTLLNMDSNWSHIGEQPKEHTKNTTGNFAHSFVLHNAAKHSIFFSKGAYQVFPNEGLPASYYKVIPNTWTLCVPSESYWDSVASEVQRSWTCIDLPSRFHTIDMAASLAEHIMYTVLGETKPAA